MIMNLFRKTLTLLIGVISLPLTVTISKAFYSQITGISIAGAGNQTYFLWGAGSYIMLHLFFFKPNYLYNLGHESVHVISTWLSFGKAKNIKVSNEGGSVQTTKSNSFISISPYFVPIYTVLLCLAYLGLLKVMDVSGYLGYFVFFIGFTFTMHIILTAEALKVMQPDLIKTGYLFSLSAIYVINVVIAAFIISLIFNGFSFSDMFAQFFDETKELYLLIFRQLFVA